MIAKLRTLNPKSIDTKYTGFEPDWTGGTVEGRRSAIMRALAWYNYHYDKKTAKQCVLDWLHQHQNSKHKAFARVADSVVPYQLGWLCRMNLRGLALVDTETTYIETAIRDCIERVESERKPVVVEEAAGPQITIQDRLRSKAQEVAAELEGMYDAVIKNDAKMTADHKPIAVIRGMNLPPQMTGMLREVWQQRLDELLAVQQGSDADLVEGYSGFSKIQIRNLIKFVEQVMADIGSYVQIRRVEKRPRKVKAVSPEHRARAFRCLATFDELKLSGLPAARLVNCSEAWLYDAKKRKLIHVVADSHVGSFTVKNNMLVGYSESESQQKTLRKPADTIGQLMAASKPAARKIFKDVKTTETGFNGRGTEHLMILRVW